MMVFYDRSGNPVVYIEDEGNIYLFNGMPAAYFSEEKIYNFNGKQLGWYENGWMRDLYGFAVLFTENHTGGPLTPLTKLTPIRAIKKLKPLKALRQLSRLRPLMGLNWSELSGAQFFDLK